MVQIIYDVILFLFLLGLIYYARCNDLKSERVINYLRKIKEHMIFREEKEADLKIPQSLKARIYILYYPQKFEDINHCHQFMQRLGFNIKPKYSKGHDDDFVLKYEFTEGAYTIECTLYKTFDEDYPYTLKLETETIDMMYEDVSEWCKFHCPHYDEYDELVV